jgi:hypothetical protein
VAGLNGEKGGTAPPRVGFFTQWREVRRVDAKLIRYSFYSFYSWLKILLWQGDGAKKGPLLRKTKASGPYQIRSD